MWVEPLEIPQRGLKRPDEPVFPAIVRVDNHEVNREYNPL
jgi:hypothetical protein